MAITVDKVMPLLVEACPSFKSLYDGLNEFHSPAPVEILMDDFADHILVLIEKGETGEFRSISQALEKIKSDGDAEARSLLKDCFFGEIDRFANQP